MRNINPNPNDTHIRPISLDTRYTWDPNLVSLPFLLLHLFFQSEEIISDIPT
jgi:hypothetical protein